MNALWERQIESLSFKISRLADEKCSPRLMVAIAGGPAAGKSTFSASLVKAIDATSKRHKAMYVPMDGFHKTAAVLENEGTTALKGKPETFEVTAFYRFLQRLKRGDHGFGGPHYSRVLHDVVADAYSVGTEDIAIVEGNYLLLDEPVWRETTKLFDYKILLRVTEAISAARLRERHLAGGRSPESTTRHIAEVDLPNYRLIVPSEKFADVIISSE